ncbi:PREDICTED: Niemann-Pick C1-like protein 1, partial [Chaetura pelagica]|uniref:Niemann-Pick C1-like protein 1 n=1 Tax=Chaetura pelagica TaxID=8897 RepID=UPI000523502C
MSPQFPQETQCPRGCLSQMSPCPACPRGGPQVPHLLCVPQKNTKARARTPSAASLAIDTMCGRYGARLCTTQRWLDFQGDKNNGLAPLQISFQLVPNGTRPGDSIRPLDGKAWSCAQAPSAHQQPCSCQDCAQSCPPVVPPPDPPPPFRLGKADGALVLCGLLFGLLAIIFLVSLAVKSCLAKGKVAQPPRPPGCSAHLGDAAHGALAKFFRRWGTWVAQHPVPVLVVAMVVTGGLSAGLVTLRLTTDPVELWSAPQSRARQEKAFYDQHFGPFFRTNQVIVTAPGRPESGYESVLFGAKNFSGVLSEEVLRVLLGLQQELEGTTAWVEGKEVTLKDVCSEYTQAEALILTYSLNNFLPEDPRRQWVLGWEQQFLRVIQDFQRSHPNLSIAFMAERSLEDEINRTTAEDLPIMATSYLVVFIYIAVALGEYTAWSRILVESKVTLALGGIAVVLGSVFASMGFLALLGLPSSLIILEVVPFLVLAVGADNIFIFVQEYQ